MNIKSILTRLSYPHKFSAIRYFLHDPRLVFGVPNKPTKMHISSAIERAMETNIIGALHNFLPEWFLDHLEKENLCDKVGFRLMLYLLVRKYKPEVVVETGVAEGLSTAYILCAMHENGKGHLYSVDLPPALAATLEIDGGCTHTYQLADGQSHRQFSVGYFVPDRVKSRWTLVLGDARTELPPLLEKLGKIDLFFHDSLHTLEHMTWEYDTAWPYIIDGGLLLSHDVLWNRAFYNKFRGCSRKATIYRTFGILKKECSLGG